MRNLLLVLGIVAVLILLAGFYILNTQESIDVETTNDTENAASSALAAYFREQMIAQGVQDIGQPIEGFDANLLRQAFAGLLPEDFEGVETVEGHYEVRNGVIEFLRDVREPITSAERMISEKGFETLLSNLEARLSTTTLLTEEAVDELIRQVNTSEQIGLRFNESATILGVTLTPLELIEDSRCPIDVTCIQAGTVKVRARIASGLGTATQVFELERTITTEAEEVALIQVEPVRESASTIQNDDYTFVFKIQKR